jgi:hypothetical protein
MVKQLALALSSPAEHGDFVHEQRRHTVMLWDPMATSGRWVKVLPHDDLANILAAHVNQPERYISVNQFHQWRSVQLLRSLQACYVDIDGCKDWEMVLNQLSELSLPSPSLLVESGRGLHLYWRLVPTPAKALPVWQAIQDVIIRKLTPLGADTVAKDCTRVLRLVGSVHRKTGAVVRGRVLSPVAWTLHELADEVLGPRKKQSAEVIGLEKARAKRQKRAASVHQRTGPYRLWHNRYQDLCTIAEHHAFMRAYGVSEGNRDKLLFLLSVALSWFTDADTLAENIARVAKTYMPSLSDKEINSYMQSVIKRAMDAKAGKFKDWNGKLRDPRYFFKTETLRRWLGPLLVPELEGRLVAFGPPKTQEERQAAEKERLANFEKARKPRCRVQEGRYKTSRSKYLEESEARAQAARSLREQGFSIRGIAQQLGVSVGRVSEWCSMSAPLLYSRPEG